MMQMCQGQAVRLSHFSLSHTILTNDHEADRDGIHSLPLQALHRLFRSLLGLSSILPHVLASLILY